MPNPDSLTTFSGVLVFFGTLAFLLRRPAIASVLFLVVGSAGVGIFWDRWSERAGVQVHFDALFSAPAPTGSEAVAVICKEGASNDLGTWLLLGLAGALERDAEEGGHAEGDPDHGGDDGEGDCEEYNRAALHIGPPAQATSL